MLLALFLPAMLHLASAQSAGQAQITFHFERPGLDVPEYKFTVHEDSSGTYEATVAPPDPRSNAGPYARPIAGPPPTHFSASFILPAALSARIFTQIRAADHLAKDCASNAKNIADTGAKTLTYSGPEGSGQCVYNYSADKSITAVTEAFQGMSFTLNSGRLLAYDERYDRLGLDHDMNNLVQAIKDSRAEAPGLIAPELKSLIGNEQVMQRVRRNASVLLDKASSAR